MKIYDQSHLKLAKIYQQKAQERHNPQKTMHEEADRVEISQAAKELLGLTKKVMELPEVRQEKVASLKDSVQKGVYQVPVEALAAKMLQNINAKKGDS
ncbi:flagellar biosynthesis anti-sigma factor FlgM [Metallumcola ferriviriculae]|uniref:Negative regulator of flagellin synthesis n=1 Tax=Metallumcola ferriviriculae TaxID=3039180 RepID=A0AAU0USU2_9FIRM|nr:flagellar biosynthesis anti-sigma factor FlgM [Desulfitibacteraceae bacterium MK1]